ncbi:class I SAM-dependent methyltransferase [Patescibacteria group bacterium]
MNILKRAGNYFFWKLYTPVSSEFWLKINGDKKISIIKEGMQMFGDNVSTLEMGAAEGYILRRLIIDGLVKNGVAFDILPDRLEKGKLRAKKEGISKNIKFISGDGRTLPFNNNEFDIVMLLDVLEHIHKKEDVIQALKEANRVAKKGILISIPHGNIKKFIDMDHIRVLLLHKNNWVYDPQMFQDELQKLSFRYQSISNILGWYVIRK